MRITRRHEFPMLGDRLPELVHCSTVDVAKATAAIAHCPHL